MDSSTPSPPPEGHGPSAAREQGPGPHPLERLGGERGREVRWPAAALGPDQVLRALREGLSRIWETRHKPAAILLGLRSYEVLSTRLGGPVQTYENLPVLIPRGVHPDHVEVVPAAVDAFLHSGELDYGYLRPVPGSSPPIYYGETVAPMSSIYTPPPAPPTPAHVHDWRPITNFITSAMGIAPQDYSCHCGAEKKMKGDGSWVTRDSLRSPWRPIA